MHCQQHRIALAFYERNIKKNTIVAIYNYQSKAHKHNIIVCFSRKKTSVGISVTDDGFGRTAARFTQFSYLLSERGY